jgi:Zn-dependent peptidase ImmA (M78 family)
LPYVGESTRLDRPNRSYAPRAILDSLGIRVTTTWLRDTWGLWLPDRRTVVIAENLNPIQERCTLAHEVEHVLAGDSGCGTSTDTARASRVRVEQLADREAARKLIGISDLALVAQRSPTLSEAAAELDVTERLLAIRLEELKGEAWPATLKIAG